jgi:hypothetical protein
METTDASGASTVTSAGSPATNFDCQCISSPVVCIFSPMVLKDAGGRGIGSRHCNAPLTERYRDSSACRPECDGTQAAMSQTAVAIHGWHCARHQDRDIRAADIEEFNVYIEAVNAERAARAVQAAAAAFENNGPGGDWRAM